MNDFGAVKILRHRFRVERGYLEGRIQEEVEGLNAFIDFSQIFQEARIHPIHGPPDFQERISQRLSLRING